MRNSAHHTSYYFLPYWREGLSALIEKPPQKYRASVNVQGEIIPTQLDGSEGEPKTFKPPSDIELYSPGDIIGFDSSIISRTDPQPHTNDFEPNFFPSVEFTDQDFPWRFSPVPPEAEALSVGLAGRYRLRPWMTLIVLMTDSKDAEFTESSLLLDSEEGEKTQRVFSITVSNPKRSLPDLTEAWRWAHVHITGRDGLQSTADTTHKDNITKWVKEHPQLAVSRLICARRLRPNTKYTAFVVPTFRSGLEAGRGRDPQAVDPLAPAWFTDSEDELNLPYYYKWAFRTGDVGDFEALVTRLRPRKIADVGLRPLDCSKPGFNLSPVHRTDDAALFPAHLDIEGALVSVGTTYSPWGYDDQTADNALQKELAPLLNQPKNGLDQSSSKPPQVVPPAYGCWNSLDGLLNATQQTWFEELNLDPRHRVVAGLGADIVRANQEAYMKAAWQQLGDYSQARLMINAADLGIEAGWCLFKRFRSVPADLMLRIFGPMFPHIPGLELDGGKLPSLFQYIRKINDLLPPILDFPWGELNRPLGPLKTRPRLEVPDTLPDMMSRFNNIEDEIGTEFGLIPNFALPPDGLPRLSDITLDIRIPGSNEPVLIPGGQEFFGEEFITHHRFDTVFQDQKLKEILDRDDFVFGPGFGDRYFGRTSRVPFSPRTASSLSGFESQTKTPAPNEQIQSSSEIHPSKAGVVTWMAQAWQTKKSSIVDAITECFTLPDSMETLPSVQLDFTVLRVHLVKKLSPADRISDQLLGRIRYKKKEGSSAVGPRIFDPEFPQPLYEVVRDRGIEWLLPGANGIKENTIGLLETNRRFIEAFLCGCNHAFSQELLWREFPNDQKGTHFAQFWDVRGYDVPEERRKDIRQKIINSRQRRALEEEIRGHYGIRVRVSLNNLEETLQRLIKAALQDIIPLDRWRDLPLGNHEPNKSLVTNTQTGDSDSSSNVVLIVRGDLLKKYPNTKIYSVNVRDEGLPDLPEYTNGRESTSMELPVFHGTLPPDITFFGFPFNQTTASKKFFVLEEPAGEPRFGLDVPEQTGQDFENWNQLTWAHFGVDQDKYLDADAPSQPTNNDGIFWETSSATIGRLSCQKPFRVAVRAWRMIPTEGDTVEESSA